MVFVRRMGCFRTSAAILLSWRDLVPDCNLPL